MLPECSNVLPECSKSVAAEYRDIEYRDRDRDIEYRDRERVIEREENKELIKTKNEENDNKKSIDYMDIVNAYKEICISLPAVRNLSEARRRAIRARLNSGYRRDDFIILFQKAQDSDFLTGRNGRDWIATFDWLIKDANMAKVLDGNYDNKGGSQNGAAKQDSKQEFDITKVKGYIEL